MEPTHQPKPKDKPNHDNSTSLHCSPAISGHRRHDHCLRYDLPTEGKPQTLPGASLGNLQPTMSKPAFTLLRACPSTGHTYAYRKIGGRFQTICGRWGELDNLGLPDLASMEKKTLTSGADCPKLGESFGLDAQNQ